jgi:uncharacterized protein
MGQSLQIQNVGQKAGQKDQMTKGAKTGHCPICKADTDAAHRPFCSSRCADIDLGKWLTGGYVIAVDDSSSSEDDGSDAAASRNPATPQRRRHEEDD